MYEGLNWSPGSWMYLARSWREPGPYFIAMLINIREIERIKHYFSLTGINSEL